MDINLLKEYINDGLSLNKISKQTNKSLTTVRYWVNKHKLSSCHKNFKQKVRLQESDTKYCTKCNNTLDINEFYTRRDSKGHTSYCKVCTNKQTTMRQRLLKQLAVDYKGGCCVNCGYNKYIGALEFHHTNPDEKDFTIANCKHTAFNDKIKLELDKCVLLCSNCHRERHNEIIEAKSI